MGREGREARGKGGSRGEHPAMVVMGLVGAGRQAGGAIEWMGWERAWSITHHPQRPLGRGAGLGASQGRSTAGQNPIKCLRGQGPVTWLPPVRRSEETVLICRLLITSDPALIPPKASPESLQVASGQSCPPAG